MRATSHFLETIQSFMNQGGWVLYLIFIAVFVLWFLVIERFWYLRFNFKKDSERILNKWKNFSHTNFKETSTRDTTGAEKTKLSSLLDEKQSGEKQSGKKQSGEKENSQNVKNNQKNILFSKIRKADLSSLNILLNKNTSFIKTLVALCPLLGLLGTVTGMIAVFEIMSAVGTGNARLMASGVSMATIPTMAGMVGALFGICISRVLENRLNKEKQKLIHFLIEAETDEKNF